MENKVLAALLERYRHKNHPKYISNNDIETFFTENKDRITREDYLAVKTHFLETLGLSRYIFTTLEKQFSEHPSPGQHAHPVLHEDPPGLDRCREQMVLKRYSQRTIKTYTGAIRRAHNWFMSELNIPLNKITTEDARKYFLVLMEELKVSTSMVRICRSSIQFYFFTVVKRSLDLSFLEGLKNNRHLPNIVSRREITIIMDCITNTKHKTMIGLLYASGLRLSELVSLRVQDVDLDELIIRVCQGKGRKDRITVFSESLIEGLQYCMRGKDPAAYVFTTAQDVNAEKKRHVSGRTVQKVLEAAVGRAGFRRRITPHDLRHSFATCLLENGISIRHIQLLLGHRNIATTTIYTKVAHPVLKGIRSPL